METEKATYEWDINLPVERALYTKSFPKRKNATLMWDIVFNPNSPSAANNRRSIFKLRLRNAPLGKIITNYSVVLKYTRTTTGNPVSVEKAFTNSFEFCNNGKLTKSGVLYENNICNCEDTINEVLTDGQLRFKIDISACALSQVSKDGCSATADSNCKKADKTSHSKQLLQSVFIDPEFCDVSIQVNETEIKAHRSILAAVSPVFRAALTNNMIEKNSGYIKIEDFTADTVKLMVDFIYNGDLKLPSYEVASHVLKAADKYQIIELKDFCAKYIMNKISKNNALEILLVADMTDTKDLKETSIDYIVRNFKDCEPSDFDDILRQRPNLLPMLLVKTFQMYAKPKK